ncbi:MAG: methyltransferase domain-containing protein [Puniceicoccaceae bacterium]
MKRYLNLGCGNRFHPDWTNVDMVSSSPHVVAHNLCEGIPYPDAHFEVVYHSHVLEHFSRKEGREFLRECVRVLKPGGIIRVAVPDLEHIVRLYLNSLEQALDEDIQAQHNYEWMLLELYDQTVRNHSGGEMAAYLQRETIPNESFVMDRLGEEGREIRRRALMAKENRVKAPEDGLNPNRVPLGRRVNALLRPLKERVLRLLLGNDWNLMNELRMGSGPNTLALKIGKFRLGGEIHQWMYDRYSLTQLLQDLGIRHVEVKSALESSIPGWNAFELESKNEIVFKPDSLFVEGRKAE